MITDKEKQEIINAVLAAIRTNSTTVDQLTAASGYEESMYVEVSGGRKLALSVIIEKAVRDAIVASGVERLTQRIEFVNTNLSSKYSTLKTQVDNIPIVYVDNELNETSGNAISNAAVSRMIYDIAELASVFISYKLIEEDVKFEHYSTAWSMAFDELVIVRRPGEREAFIVLHRRGDDTYYNVWTNHPKGLTPESVASIDKMYLVDGAIYQGTGSEGVIAPLGAMMAQNKFLSQSEYDETPDSEKESFNLFLTY